MSVAVSAGTAWQRRLGAIGTEKARRPRRRRARRDAELGEHVERVRQRDVADLGGEVVRDSSSPHAPMSSRRSATAHPVTGLKRRCREGRPAPKPARRSPPMSWNSAVGPAWRRCAPRTRRRAAPTGGTGPGEGDTAAGAPLRRDGERVHVEESALAASSASADAELLHQGRRLLEAEVGRDGVRKIRGCERRRRRRHGGQEVGEPVRLLPGWLDRTSAVTSWLRHRCIEPERRRRASSRRAPCCPARR